MTERERLLSAMTGGAVDRPPLWLREGFPVLDGPAEADDFQRGWQAEPLYRELFEFVRPHAAIIEGWGLAGTNRTLMIPQKRIRTEVVEETSERRVWRHRIQTPGGELTKVVETRRGLATAWVLKYYVETADDLRKLADVPFEVDPEWAEWSARSWRGTAERVGERGVVRMGLPTPVVAISDNMPLERFLEFSATERELFHELAEEITGRILSVLEALWASCPEMDTTANLGGSEQCTPPMMRPEAFDEYVVPYDGRIVGWLKERGVAVNMHCHGKVRHALGCMVAMGVDSTDPVEPPPAGDVTAGEAREIAGEGLTLVGNLEFDELEHAEPDDIRARVRELLGVGPERLIVGASAGPISRVTERLAGNVRAWVETYLEETA
jgi:hypothetical protein